MYFTLQTCDGKCTCDTCTCVHACSKNNTLYRRLLLYWSTIFTSTQFHYVKSYNKHNDKRISTLIGHHYHWMINSKTKTSHLEGNANKYINYTMKLYWSGDHYFRLTFCECFHDPSDAFLRFLLKDKISIRIVKIL